LRSAYSENTNLLRLRTHNTYQIFSLKRQDFHKEALALFQRQAKECDVYAQYLSTLNCKAEQVSRLVDIPFLPIQFFKTRTIVCGTLDSYTLFESSATTGQISSKHYVKDINLYESSFLTAFELEFGEITDYCIVALLPHYLEREHSSLIYMVRALMNKSGHSSNAFFLDDRDALKKLILELEEQGQKTLMIGVTFALLDFAEEFKQALKFIDIVETGGMKGRAIEITRDEVHQKLGTAWGKENIFSEYGMAELLSQSWSQSKGIFNPPPWKKVLVRELYDPLAVSESGRGALNIIDLANANSCAFIATDDIGQVFDSVSFTVEGRLDSSEVRGCNLLLNE